MSSDARPNPLTAVLKMLSPPPPVMTADYDGPEYRWKMFAFRPNEFKIEAFLLIAVLIYVAAYFIGKSVNKKLATSWFNAHEPIYASQFSRPSLSGLVDDGSSDFFNFSTGRRNVSSLHTVFKLLPRHDLLQVVYNLGKGMVELTHNPMDEVELDFKLTGTGSGPGFVWAAVAKDELAGIKANRWDLTFCKTTDSPQLAAHLSVMSEFADVTENLLKPSNNYNLVQILNDPAIRPYFRSLSITDQPRERPTLPLKPEQRERHLILSLRLPSSSSANTAAATIPLVKSAFTLIDILDTKLHLRPETKSKLKKVREELDDSLKKEAEAEKKEEAELEKQAAKKKVEEARISKLSAAEQKKALERDRKRAMRKTQAKMSRK